MLRAPSQNQKFQEMGAFKFLMIFLYNLIQFEPKFGTRRVPLFRTPLWSQKFREMDAFIFLMIFLYNLIEFEPKFGSRRVPPFRASSRYSLSYVHGHPFTEL